MPLDRWGWLLKDISMKSPLPVFSCTTFLIWSFSGELKSTPCRMLILKFYWSSLQLHLLSALSSCTNLGSSSCELGLFVQMASLGLAPLLDYFSALWKGFCSSKYYLLINWTTVFQTVPCWDCITTVLYYTSTILIIFFKYNLFDLKLFWGAKDASAWSPLASWKLIPPGQTWTVQQDCNDYYCGCSYGWIESVNVQTLSQHLLDQVPSSIIKIGKA